VGLHQIVFVVILFIISTRCAGLATSAGGFARGFFCGIKEEFPAALIVWSFTRVAMPTVVGYSGSASKQ